jgi:hypothetical protein
VVLSDVQREQLFRSPGSILPHTLAWGAETFAGDKRRFRQSPFVAYSVDLGTKATTG